MLSAQTPRAHIEPLAFPVDIQGDWLDIRKPAPSCMLHRVAYPVTEMARLPAKFTLCSQVSDSFVICNLVLPTGTATLVLASLDGSVKMIPQFRH
jgi:hypothetical protein